MTLIDHPEIQELLESVISSAENYLIEDSPKYTKKDINALDQHIRTFLAKMDEVKDRPHFELHSKELVEALNALNKKCRHDLIETMQREDLCMIIIKAGYIKGVGTMDEDITFPYRHW